MKSLLTAGLAVIAVSGMPAVAQQSVPLAQSPATEAIVPNAGGKVIWLVTRAGFGVNRSYFAIPTASMEQCELAGAELISSKRLNTDTTNPSYAGFECVEGVR